MTAMARLLRLEVRRNAMPWLVPLLAGLFWLVVYRRSIALPPQWSVRAMSMQTGVVSVFVPITVGAAAWMGARETRHGLGDLLATTARPRWVRQLATWAATTGWALVVYASCVGLLYGVFMRQIGWGGPLWWPVAVGAATVPAFTAIGFAAGALRPSRFTAPMVAIVAFLFLEISAQFIHGDHSYWQISPLVAGPWNLGANEDLATFYPYLSDLPRIQIAFLIGLTSALLGILGLSTGSGGLSLRRSAGAVTAAGCALAAIAVALAGTARLDAHGMIAVPTIHNAADDRPTAYAPVCSATPIPVCLHPAYAHYLATVTEALEPVLTEIAGLPSAPARISQTSAAYHQDAGNNVAVGRNGPELSGTEFHLLLPNQLPGPHLTTAALADAVRSDTARSIVAHVVGGDRDPTAAQRAVTDAILGTVSTEPDTAIASAAQRLAALPAGDRHAWLAQNIEALRSGRLTLQQLP
jgi:hypothetical protein